VEVQLHSFLTSALDGGECLASRLDRFTPIPNQQEAGWAPEPVATFWRREKSLAHTGILTSDSPARSRVTVRNDKMERKLSWLYQGNSQHLPEDEENRITYNSG
jgi:hypothetical protein